MEVIPNSDKKPTNGWYEWSRWVLKNIEKINERLDTFPTLRDCEKCQQQNDSLKTELQTLEDSLYRLEREIAVLRTEVKIRAGLWGAVGAAIPVIALILMRYFNTP